MRLLDDEPDLPLQVNIVPMIDAIFAILAFFIISTLFLTRLEGLPVQLPGASTAAPQQEAERVTVTIQADGSLFLNKDPLALEEIEPALQSRLADQSELIIIVNGDEAANYGSVIRVMDRLRQIEGARPVFATQAPQAETAVE